MIYSQEVENMCPVAQGVNHGAAPIPEEAKWVKSKEVKDISGFHKLAVSSLGTQSLGLGISAVLSRTDSLLMCEHLKVHIQHRSTPPVNLIVNRYDK